MRGRTTSSQHDPYELGYQCHTKNCTISRKKEIWSKSFKTIFGLISATRNHEIGITSNRKSACYGEIFI